MAAEIEFYDSNGATLITGETWPTLFAGNSSAKKKFAFKNVDVRTWSAVVASLGAVVDNDGIGIARFALDTATLYPPLNLNVTAVSASGASFVAGTTYYYVLTALSALGETIAGAQVSAVGATGMMHTLTWAAVPGATGYRLYRSTTSGVYGASSKVNVSIGAVTTINDVGAATVTGSPSPDNTTGGTSGAGDGYGTAPTLGIVNVAVGNVLPGQMVFFWEQNVSTVGMANAGNPRLWDLVLTETA